MHFGEEGNTGFVKPQVVHSLTRELSSVHPPLLVDTNTLYRGRRTRSDDHLALAEEHGFTFNTTGATLYIPDDHIPENSVSIPFSGKHIRQASVVKCCIEHDSLIGLAHFKGHLMTGFGGALKNIGMGCASREGKLVQHCNAAPFIDADNCTGCGRCSEVCLAAAIEIFDNKAHLDKTKCIGCASCIAACDNEAVELDWGSGAESITERMVEYTAAVLSRAKSAFFINIALHITKECDCLAKDDPSIIPDIGIFASDNPVALDQACYDAACSAAGGFDPFKKAHPRRDACRQLDYAEIMHIGTRAYELVRADL